MWSNCELPRKNFETDQKLCEVLEDKLKENNFTSLFTKDRDAGITRPPERRNERKGSMIDVMLINKKTRNVKTNMMTMKGLDHRVMMAEFDVRYTIKRLMDDYDRRLLYEQVVRIDGTLELPLKLCRLMDMGRARGLKTVLSGNRKERRIKRKIKTSSGQLRAQIINKLHLYRITKKVRRPCDLDDEEIYKELKKRTLDNYLTMEPEIGRKTLIFGKYKYERHMINMKLPGLTWEEKEKLSRMKFKSSSGWADTFTINRWNKVWEIKKWQIIEMVDEMFRRGWIPDELLTSGGTRIPKGNGDYRVVRTQFFVSKIIDKTLLDRVVKWIKETNQIDEEYQFAYLGRRREELMLSLYEKRDEYLKLVAADLTKAFDKIDRDEIIRRLQPLDRGTKAMVVRFITNRKLRMFSDGNLIVEDDPEGLQGFGLSPVLFVLGTY